MTKKEKEQKTTAEPVTVDYKEGVADFVELTEALVAEVDNIMSSNMPPQATGKVLGEVMSGFVNQVDTLKQKYSA